MLVGPMEVVALGAARVALDVDEEALGFDAEQPMPTAPRARANAAAITVRIKAENGSPPAISVGPEVTGWRRGLYRSCSWSCRPLPQVCRFAHPRRRQTTSSTSAASSSRSRSRASAGESSGSPVVSSATFPQTLGHLVYALCRVLRHLFTLKQDGPERAEWCGATTGNSTVAEYVQVPEDLRRRCGESYLPLPPCSQ